MRINGYQAKQFNDTLITSANRICPQYGLDPSACIEEAAHVTLFGKFALQHNYWNLPGNGDLGHNLLIRVIRTNKISNGGCQPHIVKLAKFSSADAAVTEWCRRHR